MKYYRSKTGDLIIGFNEEKGIFCEFEPISPATEAAHVEGSAHPDREKIIELIREGKASMQISQETGLPLFQVLAIINDIAGEGQTPRKRQRPAAKFDREKLIAMIKEGRKSTEVCTELGISIATYYNYARALKAGEITEPIEPNVV